MLERLEKSVLWELGILISIIVSIFGPPIGIIYGFSTSALLWLIFLSNILFVFDSIIKTWLHRGTYVFSIDFVVDISAIISAVLEFGFLYGSYTGPGLANLRVLRSLKLISRFGRITKVLVKTGKVQKSSLLLNRLIGIKAGSQDESNRYVATIRAKMQSVVMVLMGYIIIRFGGAVQGLTQMEEAKHNIFFYLEMIVVMIVIGGIIDYYLNKLVGERFRRIQHWVEEESKQHGFFRDVGAQADRESTDEVDFLERYLGIVLNKADEFPENIRKFLWGVFQPKVNKKIIFLSDIENYSGRTSDMEAEDINKLLDDYVNHIVNILVEKGAEVDKYVGDSIIAFFDPDDANKAFEAAKKISRYKRLPTRVGIHVDDVIETYVGPKGYRQMDHFSEGLSIAQRLEDYNKSTKTYLLASRSFYDLLTPAKQKQMKNLGIFKPKGAKHKVELFTIA
ncbi:MAG: adenylate/guanylate cyclase domain-containing protein [Nanobdellota archaeon]